MGDRQDLIEKLEKPSEGDTATLLYEALKLAHKQHWISGDVFRRAWGWVNAGAYESAALSLVPEEWSWGVGRMLRDHLPKPLCHAQVADDHTGTVSTDRLCESEAATPALALAAAALKARESG